ncbi:AfsR/SARP family transcriptional regulator [Streptomyces sp. NBC_01294]|uniref:AfsR/SARP family transcriptional regulator n=1 Tax=Streptomyces sp. NBC_01294 TaxID=2903815 RepID=UPI002DDAE488|nr:BTAD domain-containing putative transcriptional regulator [Streptomyces sp. NBC_01294]WRZ58720.1 winged helix-turn-helix domain-containing protein [Streptomyces sp. NBC_01294]
MLDDLQFGVFGPLTIWRNGRAVEIPQAKHRVLVAALLLRANRAVTSEELMQQLWGNDPPPTARKTLQGYIARLRKVLGAEVVVSRASGYAIVTDGDRLDLDRFNHALRQAETVDDPAERARLFRSAMDEAGGTPLVDVPSEYLRQGDGAALVERWLNATENWADAEMAVGRHAEVLPRLRALVSEHPFRESAWSRLMKALYQAGRQAEALGTYQEARRVLADELGVDPGQELRAAHRQILAGPAADEGGWEPEPSALPVRRPVTPFTLPPRLAEFARPDIESRLIRRLLYTPPEGAAVRDCDPPRTLALYGEAGVGKTTMAVRVAHAVSSAFPDGQLFVELQGEHGPRPAHDVLGELVRALGVSPAAVPSGTGELTALYRGLLSQRRALIVLDGARDEAQVEPLLPASPTCAALVTSLEMLSTLGGISHTRLGLLSAEEARDILGRIIGADRLAAEPQAAADLVEYCGRLPLAIRIVGARLLERPHWQVRHLAARMSSTRRRLDELQVGNLSVRASLAVGQAALGDAERRAFRLLSLLEMDSFPVHVAAAALGLPQDSTEELLERLTAQHLLEADFIEASGVRFAYHPLVRLYARELTFDVDSAQARHAAVQSALAAWYAAPPRPATARHTTGPGAGGIAHGEPAAPTVLTFTG